MTSTDNLTKLTAIIASELSVPTEAIAPETHLAEDLGADSVDVIAICMAIEEEWGIEIDTEDVEGFQTVQQILTYLEENAE